MLTKCSGDPGQEEISSVVKLASATGFRRLEWSSVERQADGDLHRRLVNEPLTDISRLPFEGLNHLYGSVALMMVIQSMMPFPAAAL